MANGSDPSRPSFVRSNFSSIRFNRVLGNIGAPLRDGLCEFGEDEDEDEDVILGQDDAEMQEVKDSVEERRTGMSSAEAIAEECEMRR